MLLLEYIKFSYFRKTERDFVSKAKWYKHNIQVSSWCWHLFVDNDLQLFIFYHPCTEVFSDQCSQGNWKNSPTGREKISPTGARPSGPLGPPLCFPFMDCKVFTTLSRNVASLTFHLLFQHSTSIEFKIIYKLEISHSFVKTVGKVYRVRKEEFQLLLAQ